MERKNNLLIGLTFYLENSLLLSFLALTLREFINRFCLEEFVTIPVYENKFCALMENKKQKKQTKKKKKKHSKTVFCSPSPFQTISVGKFTSSSIQKPVALLSTFNCCGLSANLYIHWLKTQAIVYELLYFDLFEGADKRVWQLLKNFKHDKEFHYVTIKSKTLTCHFNQNASIHSSIHPSIHPSFHPCMHACIHPSIHPSIQWPKWVRNDQKGYEMTWVQIDHHIVISYAVEEFQTWQRISLCNN